MIPEMTHELRSSVGSDGYREPVILLDVIVEGSGGIFSGYPVHSYIMNLLAQPIGYYEDIHILITSKVSTYGEVNHKV